MLIERSHRDELCSRLQAVRQAATGLERELLLDQADRMKLTLRTYALRDQVDEFEIAVIEILLRQQAEPVNRHD